MTPIDNLLILENLPLHTKPEIVFNFMVSAGVATYSVLEIVVTPNLENTKFRNSPHLRDPQRQALVAFRDARDVRRANFLLSHHYFNGKALQAYPAKMAEQQAVQDVREENEGEKVAEGSDNVSAEAEKDAGKESAKEPAKEAKKDVEKHSAVATKGPVSTEVRNGSARMDVGKKGIAKAEGVSKKSPRKPVGVGSKTVRKADVVAKKITKKVLPVPKAGGKKDSLPKKSILRESNTAEGMQKAVKVDGKGRS